MTTAAHYLAFLGLLGVLTVSGCNRFANSPPLDVAISEEPDGRHEEQLPIELQLDEALAVCFDRELNLEEHAAWQILHGALAFGDRFLVQTRAGGERISAVKHLLAGGHIAGWNVEPGIDLDPSGARRGLRATLDPGSKAGQGHADQWFAVLAQCGLEPDQSIEVGNHTFTMADYVAQVQWDLPRNLEQEFSWTLIGLTSYLPTDADWTASDGETWSVERLMAIELQQDLASSACGGTHRLIGMAMALNQHLAAGGKLSGVWQQANERIQEAISQAQLLQNPDGSFSSHYFERPGTTHDLAQDLGTTGHVLEFLTVATTSEQLAEPWIERAVQHLCGILEKTRHVPLECGALYHAAHGLVLYKERTQP